MLLHSLWVRQHFCFSGWLSHWLSGGF